MRKLNLKQVLAYNLACAMRESRHYGNQTKLAARSGVGQSTIGRILREETIATIEVIAALAAALSIQPHTLLDPNAYKHHRSSVAEPRALYNTQKHPHEPDERTQQDLDMLVDSFPKLSKSGQHAVLAAFYAQMEKNTKNSGTSENE